jgi:protein-glutamine gamma-glutamyltransferase
VRFAQAHKTASYLMIGAAFGALVSGGAVSPVTALFGAAGLVTSWFWEPPRIRYERWALGWTIASLAVLAISVVMVVASGDILGTGASFLVWLAIVKAHNRRAAKDWQQLYLLAFLMLVAGSVLSTDLAYGVCFLVFVVAATWTLILFHLRREMEDNFLLKHADDHSERVEVRRILESRRIVDRRFFVGTGLVSLGVFAASAVIFLAIPRVGMGFFWKSRGGLTLAGFSDGSRLGGHGRIKSDATVVMRVKVDARFEGREAPYLHWRGVAFDRYDHGAWSRSREAPRTEEQPAEPRAGRLRYYLDYDGGERAQPAIDDAVTHGMRQDIWLEPLDSDVLFGASMPLAFEMDAPLGGVRPRDDKNDELRFEHGSAIHYSVWSKVEPPPPAWLRAASGPLPPGYQVYLRLPPEITPRTLELARSITAGATTDYDKAQAIQTWLRANLSYTLDLADPGDQEPIDFFLFDRKKGHCEYFASAFVVLARAAGVPARDVNGFYGGEWNEYDDYIAVRAGDAHSWAEAYFPGAGWVTFDATPPASIDELGRGGRGLFARLRRFLDTLRFHWTQWVVEYDLYQQLALFRSIGHGVKSAAHGVEDAARAIGRWGERHWPVPLAALVAAAALIARRIQRRPRPQVAPARARHRVRSPIAAAYAAVLARLARHGHPRDPAATPRELARDLVARGVPGATQLGELTELYYRAEWGGDVPEAAIARAVELRRVIEQALRATPPPR